MRSSAGVGMTLVLTIVAGLAVSYIVAQRRRPRYAVRFTNLDLLDVVAPDRPGFRRYLPALALLASTSAMVLGLARPAWPVRVARPAGAVPAQSENSHSAAG